MNINGGKLTYEKRQVAGKIRLISKEEAIFLIMNGFCKDIIKELPLEFAMEARELLKLKLENSIG